MYRLHTKCRACGNPNLIPVVDLGWQVPANNFVKEGESRMGAAPLVVNLCEQCTLAQLSVVVDPGLLYGGSYSYVTGDNPTLREHFNQLWSVIQQQSPAKSVVEIGSNTGEFLLHCLANGAKTVLGFEPSDLAVLANARGAPTLREPYGIGIAWPKKKPDVIVARHVFAHIDDWRRMVAALDKDAGDKTLIVIEVPYVLDTIHKCELDQLYSEHLSYLSLRAIAALLKDTPFQVADVRYFQIHGGTIALFIRRKPSIVSVAAAAGVASENITNRDWYIFASKARRRIDNLRMTVCAHLSSKKVVGFGASAKSSVWIQACGFTHNDIRFICDNTPQKQGRLSPGTDIPIVPESELTNENADYAVLFAWNWKDVIMQKHQKWIDGGGTFILPHEA